MNKKAIIWGSSGHGKVVLDTLNQLFIDLAICIDRDETLSPLAENTPLFNSKDTFLNWLSSKQPNNYIGYVAIGGSNGKARVDLLNFFRNHQVDTPNLIHPLSYQGDTVQSGNGNQFLAYSNLASDCTIGEGCILNHHASIDHECEIGNGVHFAPRATLCGLVTVGNFTFIGAGAVILPRINIGQNVIIGAGAVVTKDVPSNTIVYGNPAKANN